ncbi:MAG: hypothetical protein AAGF88_09675 [Pseudomonadota bacterium]
MAKSIEDMTDAEFAEWLNATLDSLSMDVQKLAANAKVSRPTARAWVQGMQKPRDPQGLLTALGISEDSLYVYGGGDRSADPDETGTPDVLTAEAVFEDHAARIRQLEEREASLRERLAILEAQIKAQDGGGGGMRFGSSVNPAAATASQGRAGARDDETQKHDARNFARSVGEQVLNAAEDDDDFTIDNVQVEAVGGLEIDAGNVKLATNARQQANSQNASKITFSVRRRRRTQIVE